MAHRDGRRFDGQPSLSGHCGHKDHIVIEARDASPLADLVRAQAFSQSDDLRAQSFAVEFILETDHLITLQAGAKAREPLFVLFADLLARHRRRRTAYCSFAFRLLHLGIGRRAPLLGLGLLTSSTIAALSLRGNAFPQSDDLRAQSFAAEFMLETDHLVTLQAGAKTGEPLLVLFADVRKLIQPHSRGGRAQVGSPAIPLPRLGQVGIEFDDAETL